MYVNCVYDINKVIFLLGSFSPPVCHMDINISVVRVLLFVHPSWDDDHYLTDV